MKLYELIEKLQKIENKDQDVLILNIQGEYEEITDVGQQIKIVEDLKGDEYIREVYIW